MKEKGKVVRQNTRERHPMEAMALSIIQGQLANGVVYMQAALFLSLSHTHRSREYIHTICMLLSLDFDVDCQQSHWNSSKSSFLHEHGHRQCAILSCQPFVPVFVCLLVCLVSKA